MKNSDFNRYIRQMPSNIITEVFNFKSVTTFKAVAWCFSQYGHYTTGANIRVSMETLARECGTNRKTVHKVRDILIHNGLIFKTGKTPSNITIWSIGPVIPYEQLSCPFTGNSLSVLDGHNNKEHIIDNILQSNSNEFDNSFNNSFTKEDIQIEEYSHSDTSFDSSFRAQAAADDIWAVFESR
jgi:hypothetical protein